MSAPVIIAIPMSYKVDRKTGVPLFTGVEWAMAILAQDYPNFETYVLANDLMPEMLESLPNDLNVEHIELGLPPDRRGQRHGKKTKFERFANIRNMVLDHVLTSDAVYYVSVDSDVIIHPDAVSRLVQLMESRPDYGMIGGIVNNCRRVGMTVKYPKAVYNFGRRGLKKRLKDKCSAFKDFKRGTFFDVDYTGALTIMRMSMLREHPEIRWGLHRQGEDLYFCERVQEAGFKIGIDSTIVSLHMMDSEIWKQDVPAFNAGEFI